MVVACKISNEWALVGWTPTSAWKCEECLTFLSVVAQFVHGSLLAVAKFARLWTRLWLNSLSVVWLSIIEWKGTNTVITNLFLRLFLLTHYYFYVLPTNLFSPHRFQEQCYGWKRYQKMLIGIGTRLLNGHGSEMEMEMLWITRKDHRKWKWNWKCHGKIKARWNLNKKWKNRS